MLVILNRSEMTSQNPTWNNSSKIFKKALWKLHPKTFSIMMRPISWMILEKLYLLLSVAQSMLNMWCLIQNQLHHWCHVALLVENSSLQWWFIMQRTPMVDGLLVVLAAPYVATSSGWFDMRTFNHWFKEIFIPFVKYMPGKAILIGDNLTRFLGEIVSATSKDCIYFCCLPPNTNHIMQPLDIAVFWPLKIYWHKCLENWQK